MKRLLATGMISMFVLMMAPTANAADIKVCAAVKVTVNGDTVVDEAHCNMLFGE